MMDVASFWQAPIQYIPEIIWKDSPDMPLMPLPAYILMPWRSPPNRTASTGIFPNLSTNLFLLQGAVTRNTLLQ